MSSSKKDRPKTPPRKNKTAALVARARKLLSAFPHRECFGVLLFNSRGRLIDMELVHVGTLDQSLVHPREVFRPAIVMPAAAIVVCHNHPSGDAEPSRLDEVLTRRLWAAGTILGIHLYDHLVITDGSYTSLRARA